jgi:Leucine-rich repeat (LRR) protein
MFDNNILIQDLSSQALETIPDIKRAKVLQSLNLSNNKIVEFDKINDLINLRLLNISNNFLVDLLGLSSLKKLESLNVSKNKLTRFPSEISSKLKKLNLCENNICDLTYLNKLVLLESIDLSLNSIVAESFESSTFLSLNNLKFIDLTGNRITRVDSLCKSIPRGIEALFLNKNHILDLTSLYHLSVFTKLKALGISGSHAIRFISIHFNSFQLILLNFLDLFFIICLIKLDNPCSNISIVLPHHLHAYLIFLIPSLLVIDFQQINEDVKSSALKSFRDPKTFEIDQDIAIFISQGKE